MNSKICHDTLVGIPEYLHKHRDVLLSTAELPTFYIAKVRFSRFLSHPFWYKSHFFHKRKDEFEHLTRYTCWHTRVPSQTPGRVALHRRTSYILHCKCAIFPIFEPSLLIEKSFFSQKKRWIRTSVTIHLLAYQSTFKNSRKSCSPSQNFLHFTIANMRFSRFLSHPFWYKSHFFHKRKDEFEHLTRYTCWHTRVPSQTPGRVALHRRTSYILHCKCAIFPIFEPSLLIEKSFFSQKKSVWIRTSVTIHLLAYQSTFKNSRKSCSPSQNILHFTLQICDFPDFWAIPFDTKVIFSHKRKGKFEHLSRYTCWHTRVPSQTPGRVAPHRRTSYILHCKCAIFPIFEPSLLIQKSFFSQKKRPDEFEHLSRYTSWHTRVPSKTPGRLALHRRTSYILHCKCAIFPIFEPSLLTQKSFFSQKKRWIRTSVKIHLLACRSTFTNTRTGCSPSQNFLHFTLQRCDFHDFWAIPFDTKVIFLTKGKIKNSNICQDYTCWHTRVPSQTPGRVAPHRRTSYILHCKCAIFPIFEPSLLIQKSFFFHKRKDEFEHLSRYTSWHTRVPSKTPGRLALHRRTSYILHCKCAIFPIFEPSLLTQKSFFSQKKRWIRTSVKIHLLACRSTFTNTRTGCSPSQNFLHFTLQRCDFHDFWAIPFDTKVIFFTKEKMNSKICQDALVGIQKYLQKHQDVLLSIAELPTFYVAKVRFSRFLSHPFWYKSHFFHKRKEKFENLSRSTCWHTSVPS